MLGFGKPASSHFAKDERKLAALLSDAKRFKGESLWQDAWRRLKRNRSAFFSLVFLILFMGLSLLAPLLPVPSPMALDLVDEPQPPSLPWADNPRLGENLAPARRAKRFGVYSTESLGALADNGWQHRSFVDLVRPLAPGETEDALRPDEALTQVVEDVSGRESIVYLKPGEEPGSVLERHAIVYRDGDRGRVTYAPDPDGEPARARVTLLGEPGGGTAVSAVWLLPFDGPADAEARLDELGYRPAPPGWSGSPPRASLDGDTLRLELFENDRPTARYRLELPGQGPFTLRGASAAYGDAWPEAEQDYATLLDADPAAEAGARMAAAQLLAGDGGRLLLDRDGERDALYAELERELPRESAVAGLGLRASLEDALAERDLRASLASVDHVEGTWDLNWLDRQMVQGRAAVFGLWQTGPLLGTDGKGRDLLSRIVWGSRISIQASLIATLFSLLIGVTYGAFSGLMGGRVDNLMMRVVDVLYAVPFIFVVIFLLTLLAEMGVDRMKVFYVVIGAIYWLTMARVVRGQVLSLKNQEFVESAKVLGASTGRILFVHLVPNVLSIVIVYMTLTIPQIMLFEAFLSFLGLGVEAPQVSWGLLATDGTEAISAIKVFWWVVLFPALAMGATLLSLSILGDGLRDALDPKLRGKD